jgi:hypothetical protein
MPQEDRASPLRKMKRGDFPTKADVYRGLHKLGLKTKKQTAPAIKKIKKSVRDIEN